MTFIYHWIYILVFTSQLVPCDRLILGFRFLPIFIGFLNSCGLYTSQSLVTIKNCLLVYLVNNSLIFITYNIFYNFCT